MYSDTVKEKDLREQTKAPRRFFVVGPAGSGKSEFSRVLAAELNAAGRGPVILGECGEVLISMLAKIHAAEESPFAWQNTAGHWELYIRNNKQRYRGALRELGNLITHYSSDAIARAALYGKELSEQHREASLPLRICAGVRRASEFHALSVWPDIAANDVWIYVDRPCIGAVDSFDAAFFLDHCQVKVSNDADVKALAVKAKAFVATL